MSSTAAPGPESVVIGMDPHKRSATIEVMDPDEAVLGGGRFGTDHRSATTRSTVGCSVTGSATPGVRLPAITCFVRCWLLSSPMTSTTTTPSTRLRCFSLCSARTPDCKPRDRTTTWRIRPMVVSPGARSTTRTHPPTHAARGTRRRRQFSFAVHLFGGSAERAAAAFESYCNDAEEVISRSRC